MSTLFLAYIAGLVTFLSPCVLPLLPIIIFGVLNEHKYGVYLLSAGLIVSFTLFGFLIATLGSSIGLNQELLRQIAGILLILFGSIMLFSPVYQRFSSSASQLTSQLNSYVSQFQFKGASGQLYLGLILGLVWAPCIGPTLGAAISLAAQGQSLVFAFFVMLIFAVGTVTPIILLSRLSRGRMMSVKKRLSDSSSKVKSIMGLIFLGVGVLFITGYVYVLEEAILNALPQSYIQFISQF